MRASEGGFSKSEMVPGGGVAAGGVASVVCATAGIAKSR